jgi:poly-gamma-glutamate synthesis protein (capsule biosynthesis protein)
MILLGDWAPGSLHCDVSWPAGCALLNLEGPLLPAGHQLPPAPKAGPHLHTVAPPPPARPLVCALANNHIMDFGPAGLAETLSALLAAGIHAVGAGDTLDVARQPLFLDDAGTRVAILACCEAQFGVAVAAQPGVAAFGPGSMGESGVRSQADAVIVSVHARRGGFALARAGYPRPVPLMDRRGCGGCSRPPSARAAGTRGVP